MPQSLFAVLLILAAFLIAFAALLAFSMIDRRRASRLRAFSEAERDSIVFIFENERLLNATPGARRLLETAPRRGSVWAHLSGLLGPRFPRLGERMRELADLGEIEMKSVDGTSRLRAEWHDGIARIMLLASGPDDDLGGLDALSFGAMTQELDSLRAVADHAPYPLWRESRGGAITWCNAAYLQLADAFAADGAAVAWPPARVFAEAEAPQTPHPDSEPAPRQRRIAVTAPGETARRWFEISETRLGDGDTLFAALPADRLVRAETSLQEFVTTLTKTFASLPIGLAIFDRSRQLALFNPALMDLTILPADFLISKPSLSAFFDKLREARMMPEPKDYRSWRQQMADLVVAAQSGTYEETWTLPTGQTYRVSGRPHPDGAVALLFEDISAEVSVARRFRTEIEIGQAALDALPQAVAVFSPGGVLTISNDAYAELWHVDPSATLADMSIFDAVESWRMRAAPSPVWDQLRAFVIRTGPREAWSARIALADGRMLACRATPLARGATLVDFTAAPDRLARAHAEPAALAPIDEVAAAAARADA